MWLWNATFAVAVAQLIMYFAETGDAALSTGNVDIIFLLSLPFIITGTPFIAFCHKYLQKIVSISLICIVVTLLACNFGKDFALVFVNFEHSCSDSIGASDSTTLGVELWINVAFSLSLSELVILLFCGCCCSDYCSRAPATIGELMAFFQFLWSCFGLEILRALENETSSDEECYAVVLAWNIATLLLSLIKFGIILLLWKDDVCSERRSCLRQGCTKFLF